MLSVTLISSIFVSLLFVFAECVCPQTGQVHSLFLPPPPKFVSTFATLRIRSVVHLHV